MYMHIYIYTCIKYSTIVARAWGILWYIKSCRISVKKRRGPLGDPLDSGRLSKAIHVCRQAQNMS